MTRLPAQDHNSNQIIYGGLLDVMESIAGKVRHDKGGRFYIDFSGKIVGKPGKIRIYCDKQHKTFYSRQHAEATLHQIYAEIVAGTFDPDFYSKKKKSRCTRLKCMPRLG